MKTNRFQIQQFYSLTITTTKKSKWPFLRKSKFITEYEVRRISIVPCLFILDKKKKKKTRKIESI